MSRRPHPPAAADSPPRRPSRRTRTMPDKRAGESGLAQEQPFDLYVLPGYLVRRLHQIVTSTCLAAWNGLNVTPLQYAALMATREFPGIDQRGLARAIAIDRSTIGTVVGQLERSKWIVRRTSRSDRRNKEIYLTVQGAELLRRAQPIAREIQDRYLGVLTARERAAFVELLAKLVERNNHLSRAP
ncbi:MAG: MarR family winged helix-turn-helix transcriptional regulator, partial [Alphaproteobacteria bacterium]